eukprot:6191266-Pleurochrysis_carterae.AAC.2
MISESSACGTSPDGSVLESSELAVFVNQELRSQNAVNEEADTHEYARRLVLQGERRLVCFGEVIRACAGLTHLDLSRCAIGSLDGVQVSQEAVYTDVRSRLELQQKQGFAREVVSKDGCSNHEQHSNLAGTHIAVVPKSRWDSDLVQSSMHESHTLLEDSSATCALPVGGFGKA